MMRPWFSSFFLTGWITLLTHTLLVDSDDLILGEPIIYLDKKCFKQFEYNSSASGVRICTCQYPAGDDHILLASPGLKEYGINLHRQNHSDTWTLDLSWDIPDSFHDYKLLIKAKFESRGYYVIEADNLCFDFSKEHAEVLHAHRVTFPCLRIESGHRGTITITHLPLVDGYSRKQQRYRKFNVTTECQCPDQRALVRLDGPEMVIIKFSRTFAVTGYQATVEDGVSRKQIAKSKQFTVNIEEEFVETKLYIGSVNSTGVIVKVKFWCSDSITSLTIDRKCSHIVQHLYLPTVHVDQTVNITPPHRQSNYKDLAIVAVVLIVAIVSLVTVLIFRKKSFGTISWKRCKQEDNSIIVYSRNEINDVGHVTNAKSRDLSSLDYKEV